MGVYTYVRTLVTAELYDTKRQTNDPGFQKGKSSNPHNIIYLLSIEKKKILRKECLPQNLFLLEYHSPNL